MTSLTAEAMQPAPSRESQEADPQTWARGSQAGTPCSIHRQQERTPGICFETLPRKSWAGHGHRWVSCGCPLGLMLHQGVFGKHCDGAEGKREGSGQMSGEPSGPAPGDG